MPNGVALISQAAALARQARLRAGRVAAKRTA
jgi:hypothetical protein